MRDTEAARKGGLFVVVGGLQLPLLVVDSITEAIGRGAGIAGLEALQREGVAACAVRHDSACIGNAWSTWDDGVISHANAAAAALGARPGRALREWLAAG